MPGCIQCSDGDACDDCDGGNYFVMNGTRCNCTGGFYLDAAGMCGECKAVMDGCLECLDSATCTVCNATMRMLLNTANNLCECEPGRTFIYG